MPVEFVLQADQDCFVGNYSGQDEAELRQHIKEGVQGVFLLEDLTSEAELDFLERIRSSQS